MEDTERIREQDVEETQNEIANVDNEPVDTDNTEPEVVDNSDEDEDTNHAENSPEDRRVLEDATECEKDNSDDVDISSYDIDDCVKDKEKGSKGASNDEGAVRNPGHPPQAGPFNFGQIVRDRINRTDQDNTMQNNSNFGLNRHLYPHLPTLSRFQGTKHFVSELGEPQQKGESLLGTNQPHPFRGYSMPTYPLLIGSNVRRCNTNSASLPHNNKYLVKERTMAGNYRLQMRVGRASSYLNSNDDDDSELEHSIHFYTNLRSPGFIIFTRDKRFRGDIKYPLPTEKARIGKGGNGYIFTLYHEKKQYVVKKTVYRPREVNVHSALKHKNILPLAAVLMGEKHERHTGKFYCFHFMSRMDCDLRQILSSREVGCLKHYYAHCSKDPEKFEIAYNNVKYILIETLKGLEYLHSQGYVHRDVKASNIMIKMKNCKGDPLHCSCSTKFEVRLGDFDSAGPVPGLGIKEPTNKMIKYASILPLGTPGYHAPEVSMHIVLSGPYETVYTTAVDIWSFGSLCLNICIGKTAALTQREEATLLLSQSYYHSNELWEKTTKVGELQKTAPFKTDNQLLTLIRSCLQVDSKKRPTALQAQKYIVLKHSRIY